MRQRAAVIGIMWRIPRGLNYAEFEADTGPVSCDLHGYQDAVIFHPFNGDEEIGDAALYGFAY